MSAEDAGQAKSWGLPIIRIDELGSTNDLARSLAAEGLPDGTVVVARTQTHGRGRQGRTWISPPGGLWCSIVLRPGPRSRWGQLSLAASVATAEAIDEAARVRSTIRWPNDVLVGGKKVAGVLLEGAGDAVIVGTGINANLDVNALPRELHASAASLREVTGRQIGLERLLEIFVARSAFWYRSWSVGGPEVMAAWAARDALRGTRIALGGHGETIEGIADGAADDGALRVRLDGGDIRRVLAGDLVPIQRPAGRNR